MAPKAVLFAAILLCASFSVMYGQRISPTPVIEVPVNGTIIIMCESFIQGQSSSNSLQIYQPEVDTFSTFMSDRLVRSNENGGSNTNYTFGPLMEGDNGTIFRCSSSSRNSQNSTISVTFPPTITRVSPVGDQLTEMEGTPLNVVLTVMGNPQPSYFWSRNGYNITSGGGITLSSSSIIFDPVLREHAGIYTLSVMNTAGSDTHTFQLAVTYLPEFNSTEIAQNFNCSTQSQSPIPCASYPGQDGQFLCSVSGNPSPSVGASTEGVTQTSNLDFADGTSISITSVVAENAGYYVCNATSDIGSTTRRFRFYVGGPPQGVSDVRNISVEDTNVRITVAYNNSVNSVPANTIHAEVFLSDEPMEIVWVNSMSVTSSVSYTFSVPIEVVRGVLTQEYTARARVENLQGNSSAVDGFFTVLSFNGSIVLTGSPFVALLFFAVALLFY